MKLTPREQVLLNESWRRKGCEQAKSDAKTSRPIGALAQPDCNTDAARIAFLNGYQDGMKATVSHG